MRALLYATIVSLVMCSGCNSSDAKAIAKVESAILEQLRDPSSAIFSNVRVVGGGVVCGEVNSKNGFGGYVGRQRFLGSVTGTTASAQIFNAESDKGGPTLCDIYDEAASANEAEDRQKARKP